MTKGTATPFHFNTRYNKTINTNGSSKFECYRIYQILISSRTLFAVYCKHLEGPQAALILGAHFSLRQQVPSRAFITLQVVPRPHICSRKTIDASKPAFKPRKVKKQSDAKYRDRAAERRGGEGNDYAQAIFFVPI